MWRNFEEPASIEVIREAVKTALPDVMKATGKTKTQLSVALFSCPSALTRFIGGMPFSYRRLRILVDGFDNALGVSGPAVREAAE